MIEYASQTRLPKRSVLAEFSTAAPVVGAILSVILSLVFSPLLPAHPTPAQEEYFEFACALGPQLVAGGLAIVALWRIANARGALKGQAWALAGLLLSILLFGCLGFAIVSSHSWLD